MWQIVQETSELTSFKNYHVEMATCDLMYTVPVRCKPYHPLFPSKYIFINAGRDITLQELVAKLEEQYSCSPFRLTYRDADIYLRGLPETSRDVKYLNLVGWS